MRAQDNTLALWIIKSQIKEFLLICIENFFYFFYLQPKTLTLHIFILGGEILAKFSPNCCYIISRMSPCWLGGHRGKDCLFFVVNLLILGCFWYLFVKFVGDNIELGNPLENLQHAKKQQEENIEQLEQQKKLHQSLDILLALNKI